MKRQRICAVFLTFFVPGICLTVLGAPCYGTRLPSKHTFYSGAQAYRVIERDLEHNLGTVRSQQFFFLLGYGVTDWLAIDLKGAAGNIKQNPQNNSEIDYPSSFAGGYGLRVRLWQSKDADTRLVGGFQHISVHPRSAHTNAVRNSAILDDWQVSLLLSKRLFATTPYVGAKWSRLDYIHWQNGKRKRNMSDLTRQYGLVVGIDIPITPRSWLNIEGHYFDEKAVSLGILIGF